MIIIDGAYKADDGDGIGRYANQIREGLAHRNDVIFIHFSPPALLSGRLKFLRRIWYLIRVQFFIPLLIKKKFANVYHNLNLTTPLIKVSNCKYLVTVHDIAHKVFPESQKSHWRFYYHALTYCLSKKADVVISVSKTTAKDFEYWYPGNYKIITIYLGTDHLTQGLPVREVERDLILFVGTIEPRKNIQLLLDAYQLLDTELRNTYKLVIIGRSGWLSDKLINELDRLSGEGVIVWKNKCSDEELREFYARGKLFVMPSFYEGFGFPIFEALNYTIPIILSDIPIFRELILSDEVFFDPASVRSITSLIERSLSGEMRPVETLGDLTWKTHLLELSKTYEELD